MFTIQKLIKTNQKVFLKCVNMLILVISEQ